MGDVLNLNRARKRKKRQDDRAKADANAVKHGRTRAERELGQARRDLDEARLDGARLGSGSQTPSEPEPNEG